MYALTAIDRASTIAYAKVFSKLNSQISTEFLKEVIKGACKKKCVNGIYIIEELYYQKL